MGSFFHPFPLKKEPSPAAPPGPPSCPFFPLLCSTPFLPPLPPFMPAPPPLVPPSPSLSFSHLYFPEPLASVFLFSGFCCCCCCCCCSLGPPVTAWRITFVPTLDCVFCCFSFFHYAENLRLFVWRFWVCCYGGEYINVRELDIMTSFCCSFFLLLPRSDVHLITGSLVR